MENDNKNENYSKKSPGKWVLLYIVIAALVYVLIYYFFFAKNSISTYNQSQNQNNNQQNGVTIPKDKVLDLSNKNLTSLPVYIFDQTNLEELNVSHNLLSGAIQSQIEQLKNLKVLNASYNKMTGVPAQIGQLQNLQILDLSYNQLTGLPNELGNLKNLKTLNLSGNSYSQSDLNYIRNKLPATVNIIVN